jgi:pyruvate carboxylase
MTPLDCSPSFPPSDTSPLLAPPPHLQAETLAFPESVVEYFQGAIGIPPGGFPEPLRTKMLKGRAGKVFDGRPGASLPSYDFAEAESKLRQTFGQWLSDKDVLSHAMYPKVFNEWKKYELIYGEVCDWP